MRRFIAALAILGVATVCLAQHIYPGDGSDEPGFVAPPMHGKLPPPPPKTISSAETFIPFPGPPAQAMSRSEEKKPPRPPVMFTKLKTGFGPLDWSATPNDVNNLLKRMKDMVDVNYAMEVRTLAEVDADPEKNPILFRSGHYHFTWTPEERAKLRKFLLEGGMLVLNTGLGSKPFYDSAVRELAQVFPEVHLQRLSSDHPIFHAYYDVDRVAYRPGVAATGFKGNEPWFDGVTINCRTVAVISRWGMAVGWEERENPDYQAYESADAQKLGINLFAYATAQRSWTKKMARAMKFEDADARSTDRMFLAQVVYDGEWKTRHAAVPVLLHTFNRKTEVPVKFALREMRLSDPKLFEAPLIYITGHENFQLREEEMSRLREYLLNGGCLFAEACCGRKGFDLSLRGHMASLLPQHPLTPIPPEHTLFALPNRITTVAITPVLAAQLGSSTARPALEGMDINGHYAVIYSPFGMAGGWEMAQNPYAHGYTDESAMLLGQNILMYAVTQ